MFMQEGSVHPASYVVSLLQHTLTGPCHVEKREDLLFLREVEPCINIQEDSCICHNCRINLKFGLNNPTEFQPRWNKCSNSKQCQVEGCMEKAYRLTRLANHTEIETLLKTSLKATPGSSNDSATYLCDGHYCSLHKEKILK